GQLGFDAPGQRLAQGAVEVGVEHGRVDVALAADGRRVAELPGYPLDRAHHVPFRLGLAVEALELLQGLGGEDRAGPGAEVLRREVLPGGAAQVVVDVGRIDRVLDAVGIDVLEELLAGQLLAAADDARQAAVADLDVVPDATLAPEVEVDGRAVDVGVL